MSLTVQLQVTGMAAVALGTVALVTETAMWRRGNASPFLECAGLLLYVIAEALFGTRGLLLGRWAGAAFGFAFAAFFAWQACRSWRRHHKRAAALPGGAR